MNEFGLVSPFDDDHKATQRSGCADRCTAGSNGAPLSPGQELLRDVTERAGSSVIDAGYGDTTDRMPTGLPERIIKAIERVVGK